MLNYAFDIENPQQMYKKTGEHKLKNENPPSIEKMQKLVRPMSFKPEVKIKE